MSNSEQCTAGGTVWQLLEQFAAWERKGLTTSLSIRHWRKSEKVWGLCAETYLPTGKTSFLRCQSELEVTAPPRAAAYGSLLVLLAGCVRRREGDPSMPDCGLYVEEQPTKYQQLMAHHSHESK